MFLETVHGQANLFLETVHGQANLFLETVHGQANLFGQLPEAARPRQVNMSEVFNKELSAGLWLVPLYKRNKAKLFYILEERVGEPYCKERIQLADGRCCYIYVTMAVVHISDLLRYPRLETSRRNL